MSGKTNKRTRTLLTRAKFIKALLICSAFISGANASKDTQWELLEDGALKTPQGLIHPWNQDKRLREAFKRSQKSAEWLLEQSTLRTKQVGKETLLELNIPLKGGMQIGSRVAPIVEKGLDKAVNLLAPAGAAIGAAIGIKGTREALKNYDSLPSTDLKDKMMEPVMKAQEDAAFTPKVIVPTKAMEKTAPLPQQKAKPHPSSSLPVPKEKPIHEHQDSRTGTSRGHIHSDKNIYRPSIPKESVCKKSPISFIDPSTISLPTPSSFALSQVDSLIDQQVNRQIKRIHAAQTVQAIQKQIQKQIDQSAKTLEKKQGTILKKLNLHDKKIPQEIKKLLKDLPLSEALLELYNDILSHPNALMTNYQKNTAPWATTPKQEAKLQSVMTCPAKPNGIWPWAKKNVRFKKKDLETCNKNLTTKEKQYFFKYWNGDKKKHIGLLEADDLKKLVQMELLGGDKSATCAFTLKAKVVPNTIINAEILELLDFMANQNLPFGTTPYRCTHNINGDFALLNPTNGLVYPIFVEDRKRSDCFLPKNYKNSEEDIQTGKWLLEHYGPYAKAFSEAILQAGETFETNPVKDALSRGKQYNCIRATFGKALNTLGPGGVRKKLAVPYADSNPIIAHLLDDIHRWMGHFHYPDKYPDEPVEKFNYVTPELIDAVNQIPDLEGFDGFDKDKLDQFITWVSDDNAKQILDTPAELEKVTQVIMDSYDGDKVTILDQDYYPAPKTLPAFPEATKEPAKTYIKGIGQRKRWKDKKHIYEWDSQHGKVEKYSKSGKQHLGEFDHITGEQTKPSNPNRKVEK